MHKDKIKVGAKFGSEHFAVECTVQIPDTLADAVKLGKGEEFVVKMFERGWRIWCQEQSGARDFIQAATAQARKAENFPAQVQAIIDRADPSAPPKRTGRPAAPKAVEMTPDLAKAMKSGDTAKFAELLAAQGVRISIQK